MTSTYQKELIGPLLRDVSRSFYLTLRVLPVQIRPQISVAYLLARATDTIADTKVVAREKRIELLEELEDFSHVPNLGALADHQSLQSEKMLLERLDLCLEALGKFEVTDRRRIYDLLKTIISGQLFDLKRFPGETEKDMVALASDEELDRYTYLVAGCVGEFWTKMCQAHLRGLEGWKDGRMEELAVRFGKGLQLVNILRDIPRDLRIGRCYLPVKQPRALLDAGNFESIRAEYAKWLDRALEHLDAGWKYTLAIPPKQWRLRLACIWPIWIGLRTIALLRRANPLDASQRVKVPRGEVYGIVWQSLFAVRSNRALDRNYQTMRRAAASA